MYVLPVEEHELEFVTSTCTKFCNVLSRHNARHARALPLLTNPEDNSEADLRGQGSFIEAITRTRE
jgi:hypothetical protein